VASNRGLGRGLDSLLGGMDTNTSTESTPEATKTLPIEVLQRGKYQPRRHIDEASLQELAASISAQGIIQPIVVRAIDDEHFEIIAGERRWRAAQLAGLADVPVVVRKVDDRAAIAMSLIENIQRDDLNPIEEALSLQRLMEEFKLTQQQAAEAVGRSRPAISNALRLLQLPDAIKTMLAEGELEMGHARALLSLQGAVQLTTAKVVATNGMSVREAEAYIKKQLDKSNAAPRPAKDPNLVRLENDVAERVNARVRIKAQDDGGGNLTIHFNSLDELEGILARIH
jgi:ParB family transcriptional regulator, chromosome partitioning protein